MSRRAATIAGLVATLALAATPPDAAAQVHHLDEFPWYTVTDTLSRRGVAMRYDQYRDADTEWRTDRLGLVLHTAVGQHGVFFIQADFLRFDTADLSVLERWPHLAQPAEDGTLDTAWPYETMISGFGRPELGILAPLDVPLLGDGYLGLLAGLPVGRDELYPMSSASLPLRLDWRWPLGRPGGLVGAVRVGFEHTFDSGRDYLTADAFPNGFRYGVELGLAPEPRRRLTLKWAARELTDGHHSRRLSLEGLLPLGGGHALQLELGRELGGKADRYATWIASISWRLLAPPPSPEEGARSRGQNATGS